MISKWKEIKFVKTSLNNKNSNSLSYKNLSLFYSCDCFFFPASEAPKSFWGPQKMFKFWILYFHMHTYVNTGSILTKEVNFPSSSHHLIKTLIFQFLKTGKLLLIANSAQSRASLLKSHLNQILWSDATQKTWFWWILSLKWAKIHMYVLIFFKYELVYY